MLLVNVDDVLKLTNSNIKHENGNEDDEFTFFDTDKFLLNLSSIGRSMVTGDMLADIFTLSFTKGHIDYNRD